MSTISGFGKFEDIGMAILRTVFHEIFFPCILAQGCTFSLQNEVTAVHERICVSHSTAFLLQKLCYIYLLL